MWFAVLAGAFAAGTVVHDAEASAMKHSAGAAQISRKISPDPLPLVPPQLPTERGIFLGSFATPNSVASQSLLIETQTAFSQATMIASTGRPVVVKPRSALSTGRRPRPDETLETPRFILPEPASILLVLTGLIGLTARHRMHKSDMRHV
jgi:hypothetical protein